MTTSNQDNICSRCHNREKFLETFKRCLYCSKKHCHQCWSEIQLSDDYKLLLDILPKINNTSSNPRRICSTCIKNLLEYTLKNVELKKENNEDDDYQLALAMSLSKTEADKKRKLDENKNIPMKKSILVENKNENLLEKTAEAIERFINRAKSNYQRNRDVISDTALLSAFISLQTCANDLEQLKTELDHQRQYFETLQEKLTALRDAREALNILRFEYQEKKRKEKEYHDQQNRLIMLQKIADLRQYKHNQIANYQENYFQHLLNEEQQMTERLKQRKII